MTIEQLENCRSAKGEIQSLRERIERIKSDRERMTQTITGMPSGKNNNQSRIEELTVKLMELEEQLALCEQYGVQLDELERVAVKLLHSKTGACIARAVFGEPDEVFWAIYWHTTAKADMTTLEKILYVADYMEPNRDFDGVERLRELAYRDLDKALLLGVETTIQEMEERKLPVHQNTIQARAWLREHGVTTED